MKRTINYTGRARIPLELVDVRIADNEDEFFATVDLAGTTFPEDARVIAEAYERTAYERFDLGTVGGRRHTGPLPLSRVHADAALFRVKVVDESGDGIGRLLGVANKVRPSSGEGEGPGYVYEREPLLHAMPAALDGAVWRLDLDGAWPILEYEETLRSDGLEGYLSHDPVFRSLIYPQIMRQVLTQLLVVNDDREFDSNSWQEGWVQFALGLEGNEPPDDQDDVVEWIERAVSAFSRGDCSTRSHARSIGGERLMTEHLAMRFNENGREAFRSAVAAYREDTTSPSAVTLVSDDRYCEGLPGSGATVERRSFASRFEFAEYLYERLGHRWESGFVLDAGLMEWLTAFYFAELVSDGDKVKLGELARYVVTASYTKAYRHLVAGPLWSYSLCGSTAKARMLLSTPLHSPGDLYEQLASRQEIHTNAGVIDMASDLYFDADHDRVKRGAVTASRPGNLRRFITISQQLDLTYDIYSMNADDLAALLPSEFDAWLRGTD